MTTDTAQPIFANRYGFDRGSSLALGVVLLLTIVSLAATVTSLVRVGDGCVVDGNAETMLIDNCVGGWATPLRAGDDVIAIDGATLPVGIIAQRLQPPPGWVDGGTARYVVKRGDSTVYLDVPLRRMGWDGMLRAFGTALATAAPFWNTWALLGAIVLFALRPRERATQLFLVAIGGLNAAVVLTRPGNSISLLFGPAALWNTVLFLNLSWGWLFAPTLLLLVLSFPRRVRPLARRPRQTVALLYGLPLAAIAVTYVTSNIVPYLTALGLGALGVIVASVAVTMHTFLSVRDPVVRAQAGWLALGVVIGLAWWPASFVLGNVFPVLNQPVEQLPWWLWPWQLVPTLAFPLCLGIAITRYRLFDIELVVNRALVYLALTACVVGIYVLVVGYLSWLFRVEENLSLSLVATGIVAVAFAPLRNRLQRGVNRLMYGERDEPYRLLTRLGRQLESTLHPSSALALTVETVALALKLPYVAIALDRAGRLQTVAEYGDVRPESHRVPLVYAGDPIGELVVASRAPGEVFTPADLRLLHDLARQIGVAAHAVALAADLEQARLRLVTERGEERRRLGSDLHDGVGHQLTGLSRQLERATRALTAEPQLAGRLLADSAWQLTALTRQVRVLAHELFPPELELLGLAGALRERAQTRDGLRVEVDASDRLPALPAEIQAAVYLIALEAMTNVEKHAAAQSCRLRLRCSSPPGSPNGAVLELDVVDDGRGLPPNAGVGLGLVSMQARAAEVGGSCTIATHAGGGTAVHVRVPCPPRNE